MIGLPALDRWARPLTLLPDSCCTGTKAKYAAHWWALSNCRLSMTISIRVAMTLPTAGMLSSKAFFFQFSVFVSVFFNTLFKSSVFGLV